MNLVIFCVLLLVFHREANSEMSEKQLQSTIKMVRNVCQPKIKVAPELIVAMHKGDFVKDRSLMCYMECCLKMAKMITKDGKFDYDSSMAQARNIPSARQKPSMDSINDCKDSVKSNDKCEAAFEIYKCIYESNPPEFYLA